MADEPAFIIPAELPSVSVAGAAAAVTDESRLLGELCAPHMFATLPPTDSVTVVCSKYLAPDARPPRAWDADESWRTLDLAVLIQRRKWHHVAFKTRHMIQSAQDSGVRQVLEVWALHLHTLMRLHLLVAARFSLDKLDALLASAGVASSLTSAAQQLLNDVPFYIKLLFAVVLPEKPHDKAARLASVARAVKARAQQLRASGKAPVSTREDAAGEVRVDATAQEQEVNAQMDAVAVLMSSVMVELQDPIAAGALLRSRQSGDDSTAASSVSTTIMHALARVSLSTGDTSSLSHLLAPADGDATPKVEHAERDNRERSKVAALLATAQGNWPEAEERWRDCVQADPTDIESKNNLAVVLLYNSNLHEAISILTGMLASRELSVKSFGSEPVLFNVATMLELRTERATHEKIRILRSLAGLGGEDVRAGCLKLAV